MNNRSLTLSLLFVFAFLFPVSVQARFEIPVVYLEPSTANSNCSGEGPAEILSLQPDGKVVASILVVAEETESQEAESQEAGTSVAVPAIPETPSVAVVVPVSTPQFDVYTPVYSVPVQTYHPTIQPQAAVCTSGS